MILEICAIASLVTGAISAAIGVVEVTTGVVEVATAKKENIVEAEDLETKSGIDKETSEEMAKLYNSQAHELKKSVGIMRLLGGALSVGVSVESAIIHTIFRNRNATKAMLNSAYLCLATMIFTTIYDAITLIKYRKEKRNAKKNARRNK